MNLLTDIAAASALGFAVLLLVLLTIAREAGYAFGQRRVREANEKKDEGISIVVGGILALLGFVLAFNLSIATSRNGERRLATMAESNAIGTAWLQATALGDPRSMQIARLLKDYAEQRVRFLAADHESAEIAESTAQTSALQTEIWGHMSALAREAPGPLSNSLMNALNTVFDMTTEVRFAMAFGFPPQLLWLLFAMNIIAMGVLGYQFGLQGKHHRALTILLSVLWTALMVEILDIGTARIGSVRTPTFVYDWTIQGFTDIPVPPLP